MALFLLAAILPSLHPGVVLAFDSARLWLCFALIPASFVFGFFGPDMPRIIKIPLDAIAAIPLLAGCFAVSGPASGFLALAACALAAWALTRLAFRRGFVKLLYIEPLLFVWMAWRLTSFSRSSTAMYEASKVPVIVICSVAFAAWLAYAFMIYLLEYTGAREEKPSVRRSRRAVQIRAAFTALGILLLFSLALVYIPSFITDYAQRLNNFDNRIIPQSVNPGDGLVSGDGRGSVDGNGKLLEAGDQRWRNNPQNGSGDGNQYMVMVVESPVSPLYLSEVYNEKLDPVLGFRSDENYYPNTLAHAPYLETWKNTRPVTDANRVSVLIDVYSTIPEKVTSWLPYMIEPTVLDAKNFPLQYHYRAISLVSTCSLQDSVPYVYALGEEDRQTLASCLEVPLSDTDLAPFKSYLDVLLAGENSLTGRIQKILGGFNNCKYRASSDDSSSIAALNTFLFVTKSGDCTEFSHTAALLARIAGIPSRVVTGYIVSRDLQTATHDEGIKKIQERFKPLAGKDSATLFLVTSAHSHSWPEFFIPGEGWVDFESTRYAIPPDQGFDANKRDLVIPRFDAATAKRGKISIPWLLIAKLVIATCLAIVIAFFIRRGILLLLLAARAREENERGAKASFRLFLIALASRGYRPKFRSETPREYGHAYPELAPLMALYESAVFHPSADERSVSRARFDSLARDFLAARRGVRVFLRSVSGLYDRGLL